MHLVSAWATANRMVLGQVPTDAKSIEITVIPQLLALLMLEGAIVTIDAMGSQTKIGEQIIDQGGNYVLALKGNQGVLAAEVEEAFIEADAKDSAEVDSEALDTAERGHGRVETRRYSTLGDLSGVPRSALWKGMNMIGMVEFTREIDGKISREMRFFIGTGAADFGGAVRRNWGVENDLHWSLDVAMREDDCRVREIQARENLAVLRHIAMSRLKNDSTKLGIKNKPLQAGWDERYLGKLLFGTPRTAGQNAPSGDPIIAAVDAIALLPWSTGLTNQSRRRSPIRRSSDQNDTAAPEYLSKADSLPKDTTVGVFKNKLLDCASIVCAEEWKA